MKEVKYTDTVINKTCGGEAMSIENLKKLLESEREEEMGIWDFCTGPVGYRNGHGNATDRLLPLLQKAVEMVKWYGDEENWQAVSIVQRPQMSVDDLELVNKYEDYYCRKGGKKAREFLAEFTKLTDIKKEGL